MKLSSKLKTVGKLKTLVRSALICLVFILSASITATLEAKSYDSTQMNCLAQSAYHEARSEGEKGMMATIFVVINRTKDNRFPSTPCKVIAQKNQFAWYGKGKTIKELEMYDKAKQLVHEVLDGKHNDFTRGALYFVHVKTNTNWLKKSTHTCTIGNHKFFK